MNTDFVTKRSVRTLQRLDSRKADIFQKTPPGTSLLPVRSVSACDVPQAAGQDPGELPTVIALIQTSSSGRASIHATTPSLGFGRIMIWDSNFMISCHCRFYKSYMAASLPCNFIAHGLQKMNQRFSGYNRHLFRHGFPLNPSWKKLKGSDQTRPDPKAHPQNIKLSILLYF